MTASRVEICGSNHTHMYVKIFCVGGSNFFQKAWPWARQEKGKEVRFR